MERTSPEILVAGCANVGLCALTNTLVGQVVSPEHGVHRLAESKVLYAGEHGYHGLVEKRKALYLGLEVAYSNVNFTNCYVDHELDECLLRSKANTADAILYCVRMSSKNDISGLFLHFSHAVWKKMCFVLTFANDVKLNKFQELLNYWRAFVHGTLRRAGIDKSTIEAIPIVPAGYDPDDPLPGCENWLSRLWYACLFCMNEKAQSAFLKASFNFDAKIVAGIKLEALPARLAAEFKDTIQLKQATTIGKLIMPRT